MPRHILIQIALLSSLGVAGCHNAGTDNKSSQQKEQPTVTSSNAESAQKLVPAAASDQAKSAASAPASSAKLPPPFRGDEAWVLVEDENIYIPVIDDLGQDLLIADAAIRAGKNQDAAATLRNGARYLLAQGAAPDAHTQLASAAKELNSLAQDLEHGKVDSKRLARVYQQAFDADLAGQWIVADIEDSWQPYSRRPGQHLDRAFRELKSDPHAAAVDVREANSYLRVEALRHSNDQLQGAISELAELADQIQQGKVKDPSLIESAIEDSGHALAYTHYHVAVDAWERHDHSMASHQLKESVAHLKHAASRVKADTKVAIDTLSRDAELLVQDATSDVSTFAKRVDAELKQFKTEIESHHPKTRKDK
jgi:hypothetical protein